MSHGSLILNTWEASLRGHLLAGNIEGALPIAMAMDGTRCLVYEIHWNSDRVLCKQVGNTWLQGPGPYLQMAHSQCALDALQKRKTSVKGGPCRVNTTTASSTPTRKFITEQQVELPRPFQLRMYSSPAQSRDKPPLSTLCALTLLSKSTLPWHGTPTHVIVVVKEKNKGLCLHAWEVPFLRRLCTRCWQQYSCIAVR